ncbi:MAG: hypothetical protein WCP98_20420, partial [Actinomycetes bacterium]
MTFACGGAVGGRALRPRSAGIRCGDAVDDDWGEMMTGARSGRFAGERAPAFVALNSSLALDWRLWPEDIE